MLEWSGACGDWAVLGPRLFWLVLIPAIVQVLLAWSGGGPLKLSPLSASAKSARFSKSSPALDRLSPSPT